ncbi:hypothetical protein PTKU46_74660 [Paraburkholderia terrae]|uniref:hypothetical protein n=1 Tax=Paraburkholderia terrae TaxID=311230 RepID=UPI0030E57B62
MTYSAFIKDISQDIEGEVTLLVNGLELTCFSNMPPPSNSIGTECEIEFLPMVFGDYDVHEVPDTSASLMQRIGNSFSYLVSGRLNEGVIDAGAVTFEDEILGSEFGYLDGKMVTWKIERLDVDFQ